MLCSHTSLSEHLPQGVTTTLVLVVLALALAPYFAGKKLGPIDIPDVKGRTRSTLRWCGPVLFTVLCMLLFVPPALVLPSRCSPLRNPGAEAVAGNSIPSHWKTEGWKSGGTFRADSAVVHSGRRSFYLASHEPNHLRWFQEVQVEPESNYRASAWVRGEVAHSSERVDKGANLAVIWVEDGQWHQYYSEPVFSSQGEWQLVEAQFPLSKARQVGIFLQLGAFSGATTGEVWFDDVQLEKE